MLRKFVRNKSEPPCEEVELLEANPTFAYVRFPDGKESSVSSRAFRSKTYLHVRLLICPLVHLSKRLQIIFRKVLSQNLVESRM